MANINKGGAKFTIDTIDNLSPKLEQVAKSAKKAKKEIDDLGNEIDDLNKKTAKSRLTPISYSTDLAGKVTGVQKYQGANSKYTTGTMSFEQFKSSIGGQSIADLKRIDSEARKANLREQIMQRQNLKVMKDLGTPSFGIRNAAFDKINKPLSATQKLRQQEQAWKEVYGSSMSAQTKQAQMNAMFAQNERASKENSKLISNQTKKEIALRNETLDIAKNYNKQYAKNLSDKIKQEKKDNIKFQTEQNKIHKRSAKERELLEKRFNKELMQRRKLINNAPFSALGYRTDLNGKIIGTYQARKSSGFTSSMYNDSSLSAPTMIDPKVLNQETERKKKERASYFGTTQRAMRYLAAYKIASTIQEAPARMFENMRSMDALRNSAKVILSSQYYTGGTKEQDISNANKEIEYLYGLGQKYGVNMNGIASSHIKMLGAGGKDRMSLDKIRAVTETGAIYSALFNLTAEETSFLQKGFQQTLTKEKISAEEVNQQINEQVAGFYDTLLVATNLAINDPRNAHKYAQYRGKINRTQDIFPLMKENVLGAGVMPYLKQALELKFGDKLDDKFKSLSAEIGRLSSSISNLSDISSKGAVPAISQLTRGVNFVLQTGLIGMKDEEGNKDYYTNIYNDPKKTKAQKALGTSFKLLETGATSAAVALGTKYAIKYGSKLLGFGAGGGAVAGPIGALAGLGLAGYTLYQDIATGAKKRAENLPLEEYGYNNLFDLNFIKDYNERGKWDKIWNRKGMSVADYSKQNKNLLLDAIANQNMTPIPQGTEIQPQLQIVMPKQEIELVLRIEGGLPNGLNMTPYKTKQTANSNVNFTFDTGKNISVGGVGGY